MRLIFISTIVLLLASGIGLGATWMTSTRGTTFGAITIGAWTARPKSGTSDIDPYSRASVARSGELPVGTGDGITFIASTDDKGRTLDGRCDVVVSGTTPPARFWTMTLYDTQGQLVAIDGQLRPFRPKLRNEPVPAGLAGQWLHGQRGPAAGSTTDASPARLGGSPAAARRPSRAGHGLRPAPGRHRRSA